MDEAYWSRFHTELETELEPLRKAVDRLDKSYDCLDKRMSVLTRLDKRMSVLTEDKARSVAKDMFGSYFSKRFKSIDQVVKHISKANDPKLPSEHSFRIIADATTNVARYVQPHLPAFVKAAYRALVETATAEAADGSAPAAFVHDSFKSMIPSRTPFKSCRTYSRFLTMTRATTTTTATTPLSTTHRFVGGCFQLSRNWATRPWSATKPKSRETIE
jgi:hypothetical protein